MVTSSADAVVVGAGPAGSAAAAFLAAAGRSVIVLEKATFPREKVCGDGLTPRAVRALRHLGLHDEAEGIPDGWARQNGLRMYGGGVTLDLPWPALEDWPAHSVTATRALFDHTLARHATASGAVVEEGAEVTGPTWVDAAGTRVSGVAYRRADGTSATVRAPVVVVADGGSSRFAVQLGLHRDERRPMGVAVRAYYRSPRAAMDVMEGFLTLRSGTGGNGAAARQAGVPGELLPGYGWIFPLDDGLVNVGWGLISTSEHFRGISYRRTLADWVSSFPESWGMGPQTLVGRPASAGLPMGHNRRPHVAHGALLVGDAGGMVNPFNGEGISYAIEAGAFAAEAVDEALRRGSDGPLHAYPARVAAEWGGYYRLGGLFLQAMGHPAVMRFCTEWGMPRPWLMRFVFRVMAHLVNRRSRDVTDAVVNVLSRAVPAA